METNMPAWIVICAPILGSGIFVALLAWFMSRLINQIDTKLDRHETKLDDLEGEMTSFKLDVAKSGIDVLRNDLVRLQQDLGKLDASDNKQWEVLSRIGGAKKRTSDQT